MDELLGRVAREARLMTRHDVLKKALAGKVSWRDAATVLGLCPRQMLRLRRRFEAGGAAALADGRTKPRRHRVSDATIEELFRLRRERYVDFSVRHFYEHATEKHGLKLSYTTAKALLQKEGLAVKSPARGKHRRKRERRPMRGMMLHLDASTHVWLAGLPHHDLMVMIDDATSEILYAQFFEQEGVLSTLAAIKQVLVQHGRFGELYTDRGTHFCTTTVAGRGPNEVQTGVVPSVLHTLKIRQIWAYSPQARGRSERAFGTLQARLPQELTLAGIKTYEEANRFLRDTFIESYNSRAVAPAQPESAFAPLVGIDLEQLMTVRHDRVVHNDNTVMFKKLFLQLPKTAERMHYVRCEVVVHEFPDGDLGVSYQGQMLGRAGTGRPQLEKRNGKLTHVPQLLRAVPVPESGKRKSGHL